MNKKTSLTQHTRIKVPKVIKIQTNATFNVVYCTCCAAIQLANASMCLDAFASHFSAGCKHRVKINEMIKGKQQQPSLCSVAVLMYFKEQCCPAIVAVTCQSTCGVKCFDTFVCMWLFKPVSLYVSALRGACNYINALKYTQHYHSIYGWVFVCGCAMCASAGKF